MKVNKSVYNQKWATLVRKNRLILLQYVGHKSSEGRYGESKSKHLSRRRHPSNPQEVGEEMKSMIRASKSLVF